MTSLSTPVDAAANLAAVEGRVVAAAEAAGRGPADVTLVAVGKRFAASAIRPVLDAGHRVFGENRVQEAAEKWPGLREDYPNVTLHLIGALQSNKARDAVALFDVIETVDRPKLARALAAEMDRAGRRPDCFVQVNTGEEAQKAGVWPEDADAFIALCVRDLALPIKGLMCLPPLDEEPALHFALLGEIAKRNGLACLSMGMSADFETAIQFGATHVRLGTAIFGPRPPRL
jgi:pyridoxal phosphate enzyme (YggS family)